MKKEVENGHSPDDGEIHLSYELLCAVLLYVLICTYILTQYNHFFKT